MDIRHDTYEVVYATSYCVDFSTPLLVYLLDYKSDADITYQQIFDADL
jgi:hypothetical protein